LLEDSRDLFVIITLGSELCISRGWWAISEY